MPTFTESLGARGVSPIQQRLSRLAAAARIANPFDLPVYGAAGSPSAGKTAPTVTVASTAAGGLSVIRLLSASGTGKVLGVNAQMLGGIPIVYSSGPVKVLGYSASTNPTLDQGSRPTGNSPATSPYIVGVDGEVRPSGTYTDAQSNGHVLATLTDADVMSVRVTPGTGNLRSYFRVKVDGQYVSKTPTAFANGTDGFINIDFGSRAWRRVELETGVPLVSLLGAPATSFLAPGPNDTTRAVFVTDSYGVPTGTAVADGQFLGWTDIAAAKLGWGDVRKVSIGGRGWLWPGPSGLLATIRQSLSDAVLHAPNVLVLQGSINDALNAVTPAALQTETAATIAAYRGAFPNAMIYVTGIPGATTGPNAALLALENAMAAAVQGTSDPLLSFVPVSTDPAGAWFTGAGTGNGNYDLYMAGGDNLHPITAGHLMMANRFVRGTGL